MGNSNRNDRGEVQEENAQRSHLTVFIPFYGLWDAWHEELQQVFA